MSINEAWEDFYQWAKLPENWKVISPAGRDQIAKAQRSYQYWKGRGAESAESDPDRLPQLGPNRIESLLTKHAPDRYRFDLGVYLVEDE